VTTSLKHKVISGLVWRGMERVGTQVIGFAVSIILARLLEPKEFGLINLITVFIAMAGVFVSGGFGTALVQKKDVTETDYNSIFYLTLAVAVVLYGALFVSAPWIAHFFNDTILVLVVRILSVSLIVGAVNSIQNAVLIREMRFKLSFKTNLISMLVSGIVGVSLAYSGYGVWALVGLTLVAQVTSAAIMWKIVAWRPRMMFSIEAIRQMFGFSSKVLVSGLLDTFFSNIYSVIIGKLFNPTILGYYSRGQSIPNMAMSSVQGTIASVIFPALTSCQQDRVRVKEIVRRMIKSTCFIIFPMMIGLAVVAKTLVLVLLTDKWLPCVPYLQFSCIIFALVPLNVANLQAIMALGRSDIYLTLEISKKVLIIGAVIITFRYGVLAMVIGQVVSALFCATINAWPNRQLLNYSLHQQVLDILPACLLATGMGAFVWGLAWVILNVYFLLVAQIVLGVMVYIAGAKLFKLESAAYLWQTSRNVFSGKTGA
jgi:O-antigen/teichoic acid export membrane protein